MTNAPTPQRVVEITNLIAGYVPGVDILRGATMHVDTGEMVCIIGPNGAGKSTLVKAIFGLVPIRSGTVQLNGDEITGAPGHELVSRGVGYVPQVRNVFGTLNVEENLRMGVFLRPGEFHRRRDEIFELFPVLGERRHQRAESLSGGQRQAIAVARSSAFGRCLVSCLPTSRILR